MSNDILSLIILAVCMVLYITEFFPVAVTAVASAALMALLGIIPQSQALAGFSSETVFIVAGMMVVGTTLLETGVAHDIGKAVVHIGRNNDNLALCLLVFVGLVLSSFMNNSTATATLIPVFFGIIVPAVGKLHEKDWMLPLAVATNVGGLLTLLGSTPQLLLHSYMQQHGLRPFGFFEYGKLGVWICIAFVVYAFTVGRFVTRRVIRRDPRHSEYYENFSEDLKNIVTLDGACKIRKTISAGILVVSVTLMAVSDTMPLSAIAVMAAVSCVMFDCVSLKMVYRKLDWTTVFVLAGTIGFATGLDKSGAGKLITDTILSVTGEGFGAHGILAIIVVLAALLTQFMSNTATCAMFLPIALSFASALDVSPYPMLMGVAMSASCSFSTPIATPAMTLVLSPGGYRFTDYIRWASLLNLIAVILIILLVPVFWPF